MLTRLFLALLMALPLFSARADEAARQRLIDRLEATSTLSAAFTQQTYAEGELRGEESSGRMRVARPLKFSWQVETPYEQRVLSDGETLWVYDPDLEQATYQPVDDQIRQSPAMILSQPESTLTTSYEVTEASNDSLTAYRLYPTDENAAFSDLTLLFDGEVISEIRLSDNLGQDTRITFSEVRTDRDFADDVFEFEPPPGTDVFEQM